MDPETTLGILTAAAAGKALIGEGVKDLYKLVKDWLFGSGAKEDAEAAAALERVEEVPDSPSLQEKAKRALQASRAMQNPEFLAHLDRFAASMSEDKAGAQMIIQAFGQGAIAAEKIGTVIQGNVHGIVNRK